MFSKGEIELCNKLAPDKKFMLSKAGLDAAQKGYDDAAKDAAKY